jgi:hypothetical protein
MYTSMRVKITPTAAHTTPPNSAPTNAALSSTRVFGMYEYTNMKSATISTYGANASSLPLVPPS